jgi:hypothetical protein
VMENGKNSLIFRWKMSLCIAERADYKGIFISRWLLPTDAKGLQPVMVALEGKSLSWSYRKALEGHK